MGKELIEHLLDNNLDEFKARFTRVLQQTPKDRAPRHIEFWIYFFLGSATTIQDQQLGSGSEIEGICFNVNKKILKLAFKTQDDNIIIRYIEVVNSKNPSNRDKIVEQDDLNQIKNTLKIEKDITTDDIKYIKINVEDCTVQLSNNQEASTSTIQAKNKQPQNKLSRRPKNKLPNKSPNKSSFKKINSGSASKGIDSALGLIATTRDVEQIKKPVENLFQKLADLYNANSLNDVYKKNKSVYKSGESTYHGFVYGALRLNYKNKYHMDVYVEHSSGRGYLDLYFLLRSNNNQKNDDQGQSAKLRNDQAIPIIVEFKADANTLSVQDGIQQIEDRAYVNQLVVRTNAKHAIGVSANFASRVGQILVKKYPLELVAEDFIDVLISTSKSKSNIKTTLEKGIKNIFHAIHKEESLDLIVLGELLSSQEVKDIDIYTFLPAPDAQKTARERATVFVFTIKENNPVVLSIIGMRLNTKCKRANTIDSSTRQLRSNTEYNQNTLGGELKKLISHIKSKLEDGRSARIFDIYIDPNADIFINKGQSTKTSFLWI